MSYGRWPGYRTARKEVSEMRRIIVLLTVAMVVAAMMVVSAIPAFAAPKKCPPGQTATVEVVGTEVIETCRIL